MSVSHFRTTTLILAALTLVAQGAARADALADGRLISASVCAPAYRSGGPLAFGRLRTLTPEPAVGRTCEIDIGLTATFDDPFNPEQISIDADIQTPSRKYAVPCFFYEPCGMDSNGQLTVTGKPTWRLRFLPTEQGTHRVAIRAIDKSGSAKSDTLTVAVADRRWPGLLRVSKKNPRVFVFENAGPRLLAGFNVIGEGMQVNLGKTLGKNLHATSETLINRLADSGGNLIRWRADSSYYGIDNSVDPITGFCGPGRFHQRMAWLQDYLLGLCEKREIQVIYTIEDALNIQADQQRVDGFAKNVDPFAKAYNAANETRHRLRYNLYLKQNGGVLDAAREFWTGEAARALIKRKLRYTVARYGASPSIGVWEFFNEVHVDGRDFVAWHETMSDYLKSIDPHERLVSTSLLDTYGEAAKIEEACWKLKGIDFTMRHKYDLLFPADFTFEYCGQYGKRFAKPFILGEYGGQVFREDVPLPKPWDPSFFVSEELNVMTHLAHWGGAMAGSVAMDWYAHKYLANRRFFEDFAALSAFFASIPLEDSRSVVVPATVSEETLPEPRDVVYWNSDWGLSGAKPPYECVVHADGSIDPPRNPWWFCPAVNGAVFGKAKYGEKRHPPAFRVNYQQPGKFIVTVCRVFGQGSNQVQILLDGAVALEEDLPCGLGKGKKSQKTGADQVLVIYDRELAIDVPAGEHVIGFDNLGSGQLFAYYRFKKYATSSRPEVSAFGLVHSQGADVWAYNRSWGATSFAGITTHTVAKNTTLKVDGLRDGAASVEWVDPWDGTTVRRETVSVRGGAVTLSAGDVLKDVACHLRYR